jgi:hypothetical protein
VSFAISLLDVLCFAKGITKHSTWKKNRHKQGFSQQYQAINTAKAR